MYSPDRMSDCISLVNIGDPYSAIIYIAANPLQHLLNLWRKNKNWKRRTEPADADLQQSNQASATRTLLNGLIIAIIR